MYYRFEAKENGKWVGIFQLMNYGQLKQFKSLTAPKWYNSHTEESRCWFTQKGYDRYKDLLDAVAKDMSCGQPENVRILECENLDNVVMRGSVQCIVLV